MPFGWVFVVLTTFGAIGGVVTGLSAHSIRTASVLPLDEAQPFEPTHSISALTALTALTALPAPRDTTLVVAKTQWPEDSALFSPVPAYPVTVAYAPAAASIELDATPEEAKPEPQPAAEAKPAARHVSSRPGSVLNDAQIASIRERLNLTPDQQALWPAVETALRNVSYIHRPKEVRVASAGNTPMAYVDTNSAEVQQLKYAALPLIMRLNDDQKREVKSMAHVMGLESVASGF
jgi:hypothetical protein